MNKQPQPPNSDAQPSSMVPAATPTQGFDWKPWIIPGAVFILAFGFCCWPVINQTSYSPKKVACIVNLKQLSIGLLLYAQDNGGRLPPARSWATATAPYTKDPSLYHCPKREKQRFGYAFNSRLGGAKVGDIKSPDKVPMLFETLLDIENAADPVASFVTPHAEWGNVAFLDGHYKSVRTAPPSRFETIERKGQSQRGAKRPAR